MDDFVTVEIQGLEALQQRLNEMSSNIARKILRKAAQKALNVLKDAVSERTPVDSGLLKSSVTSRLSVSEADKSVIGKVGFGKQGFVARMQEFGHRIVTHKPGLKEVGHVPAKPFMRPAFDASAQEAVDAFVEEVEKNIYEIPASNISTTYEEAA